MRLTLRKMAMAGVLATASASGVGVTTARACDHAPARGFGPVPQWGSGGVLSTTIGVGSLPDYDHCPVCQPRSFVPPPCPPPPCPDEFSAVVETRYVSYREYPRPDFPVSYPGPPALDSAPRAVNTYEAPYYPATPPKQAPGVYGSSQYPVPSSGQSAYYGSPRAQAPYRSQAPPAGYDQAPPLPTPSGFPQS
jgi:hypothetical protein